jgi:hypothetical protein
LAEESSPCRAGMKSPNPFKGEVKRVSATRAPSSFTTATLKGAVDVLMERINRPSPENLFKEFRHRFNPCQIVDGHHHDENRQKKEPGLLRHITLLEADGPAQNQFNDKKENQSAVKDRNGEQVEDPQVDADDGKERHKIAHAFLRDLPGQLADHDGAADSLDGYDPLKELHDGQDGEFDDLPCFEEALSHSRPRCELHLFVFSGSHDADAWMIFLMSGQLSVSCP